jgi:hypothetical protein
MTENELLEIITQYFKERIFENQNFNYENYWIKYRFRFMCTAKL